MESKKYKLLYLLCFSLFSIGFVSLYICNKIVGTNIILGTFILSLFAFFVFLKEDNLSDIFQMCIVYTLLSIFIIFTLFKSIQNKIEVNKLNAGILCVSVVIPFICTFIVLIKKLGKNIERYFSAFLKKRKYLIGIILAFILVYFTNFFFLFKSDSNTYYLSLINSIGLWNFEFDNLSCFELGYHKTYGYSLFLYIGQYLLPHYAIGVRLVNLFIYIITLIMVYEIYSKYTNKGKIALYGSLICFFSPVVLGISQEISTDMPLMCFFIWLVYCSIYKKKILFVFNAFLLCFSKEIGVLLLCTYLLGIYLIRVIKIIKNKKTIFDITSYVCTEEVFSLYSILFFLIIMKLAGNAWGEKTGYIQKKIGLVNSIQFNPNYIKIKVEEIFILNFQWILVGIIIFSLIFLFIKRKKLKIDEHICGILVTMFAFILFNLLYFTYPHSRYLQLNAFFYGFLFVLLGNQILNYVSKANIYLIIDICFICLQCVQIFFQIDPISNVIFNRVETGNGSIISLAYYNDHPTEKYILISEEEGADLSSEVFRDYVQINRSYLRFETLFEKIMQDIDYKEDDYIYILPIYHNDYWGDSVYTFVNMFGVYDNSLLHWNRKYNQITYENNDISINWVESVQDIEHIKTDGKIWCIYFPFEQRKGQTAQSFIKNLNVIGEKEYKYFEWKIYAYQLDNESGYVNE